MGLISNYSSLFEVAIGVNLGFSLIRQVHSRRKATLEVRLQNLDKVAAFDSIVSDNRARDAIGRARLELARQSSAISKLVGKLIALCTLAAVGAIAALLLAAIEPELYLSEWILVPFVSVLLLCVPTSMLIVEISSKTKLKKAQALYDEAYQSLMTDV